MFESFCQTQLTVCERKLCISAQCLHGNKFIKILEFELLAGGDLTYMGYLNKTCSAGPSDSVSGATAGPLLRSSSTGNSWTMFTLKKVGKGGKKEDLVEIHTYYPASGKKPL